MSTENKHALVALIQECVDVIEGEMKLLENWSDATDSNGRRTRCLKRKARIRQNSYSKIESLLDQAVAIPSDEVKSSPDAVDRGMVASNVGSLKFRKSLDVNALSNPKFTRCLERAETNSKDSVKDARVILCDCEI